MAPNGTGFCVSVPLLFIHRVALPPPLLAQAMSERLLASKSPMPTKLSSGWKLMVVVAAALRLFEALPSLTTQLTVRVGLAPELVGLAPEVNVTESSTLW